MKDLGYYNGLVGPLDEMTVPMNDRGFYFGDGIYEAALEANGKIFTLDEHLDRFFVSANLVRLSVPYTKSELKNILYDALAKVDVESHLMYWQLTRGAAPRAHVFSGDKANLAIMIKYAAVPDIHKKVKLVTKKDERFSMCNIKTLNLLPNVLAAQFAKDNGAAECVFIRDGFATECSHSNVHIIKDGAFITHPADNLILRGIAREHLLAACYRLGIPTYERAFSAEELFNADEIISSSTSSIGIAADTIDGKPAGGKAPELLKKLQDEVFGEFCAFTGFHR
jgi:D-alanine transaminase